jgi:hypothetical protein
MMIHAAVSMQYKGSDLIPTSRNKRWSVLLIYLRSLLERDENRPISPLPFRSLSFSPRKAHLEPSFR